MANQPPLFINQDAGAITAEIIADIETRLGKTLHPAQDERILIDQIAYRESLCRMGVNQAALKNLVMFSDPPVLNELGRLVCVEQLAAQAAETILEFSFNELLVSDVFVPSGTLVETADGEFAFSTVSTLLIPAGSASGTVKAVCTTTGKDANNYTVGQINSPVGAISCDSVQNITVSSGGADAEDVENFRQRIITAPEQFSTAGSKDAYVFHTKSAHSDIADVYVTSPDAGEVDVVVLSKSGEPSEGILDAVKTKLNADDVRPMTDLVRVRAAVRVEISCDLQVYYDPAADLTALEDGLNRSLNLLKSKFKEKLGLDVLPAAIIANVMAIPGVQNVVLNGFAGVEIPPDSFADVAFDVTYWEAQK